MKDSTDFSDQDHDKKGTQQSLGDKDFSKINQFPISANKQLSASTSNSEPLSLSTKSVDLTSKFVAAAHKDEKKDGTKVKNDGDMLLDFSRPNKTEKVGALRGDQSYHPQSPSVSIIIKNNIINLIF